MARLLKFGSGWRIGWNPDEIEFQGLVGADSWAIELTELEFNDFRRLLEQLTDTINQMREELMDQEAIACEMESELLWLEAQGNPDAYSLHLILHSGRRGKDIGQQQQFPV